RVFPGGSELSQAVVIKREQIVRLTLLQAGPSILAESPPSLLLTKFLQAKESFMHQAILRRTG
ncbi:hypothetical protein J0895_03065, partial [Phormidium pseudopriestleyi FRX01]